jgi:predicted glycogen debranching enzyme
MAQIQLDQAEVRDLQRSLDREWLITNGLGGYASGTVSGLATRRYHALLVAARQPPVQRMALLVRMGVVVRSGEDEYDLSTFEFADGTLFPQGYQHLASFMLDDGVPTWTYILGTQVLRARLWMVPGHNTTVMHYKLVAGNREAELVLRPLVASRSHHALQHGAPLPHFDVQHQSDGIRVQAEGQDVALWLAAPGAAFVDGGDWYWNFLVREERVRGYDHIEHLFQPGIFRASLEPGDSLTLVASSEDLTVVSIPDLDGALVVRRNHATRAAATVLEEPAFGPQIRPLAAALLEAAEAFLVQRVHTNAGRTAGNSVIAGYPWFTDWGRDAMIAIPGLLLTTRRADMAASVLRSFAGAIADGLLPNRFTSDGAGVEYNTADAALWYFRALEATYRSLNGETATSLLSELYPRLVEIVSRYQAGTRFGIAMDPTDGLLCAGLPGTADTPPTQLTWMDARVGDEVITPRIGKPVEINALWIAALDLLGEWAERFGDDPDPYRAGARRARSAFAARFWYAEGGYLYDVIDGPSGDDPALRPNQLVALAMEPELLTAQQAQSALSVVQTELLTPYGLRTLSPRDPRYQGHCVGDTYIRDHAYHQGTVWPWLLAPYARAHHRLYPDDRQTLVALLLPFARHLYEAGIGNVSEVFDGDAPHTPRGCIAQAWSVAALLEILELLRTQR